MVRKRVLRVKRVRKIPAVRKDGGRPITRAEFDGVIRQLNERGEIINDLRRELDSTCRDLTENIRRDLQTQFTRIAQMQQDIDDLKRKNDR